MEQPGPAVSGITPSGSLTLGNYLGALRRFARDPGDGFYFVADLHAMTTAHNPRRLAELTRETAVLMLAAGIPGGMVFVQSEVPAHTQIGYLLECTAYTGELSRMIQYKEKGSDQPRTRASLFTYPCLMAADILLYDAARVPVGGDQDQHVELARDLALRFNRTYGDTFVVPEVHRAAAAGRVLDLSDPTQKMSKSAPTDAAGVIRLLDNSDSVRHKVMRSVTDSENQVGYDPENKPGVSNLLDILAALHDEKPSAMAAGFSSYRALKEATVESIVETLRPVQARYADLVAHPTAVEWALQTGRDRAIEASSARLNTAYQAIGLTSQPTVQPTTHSPRDNHHNA